MEDDSNFLDIGATVQRQGIVKHLEHMLQRIKIQEKEVERLTDKVKRNKYQVVVVSPEEIEENRRKARKTQTNINREVLATLQEHAIDNLCSGDCKRKKSKCRLRTALLKSNTPQINFDKKRGTCEYWLGGLEDDNN